MDVIFIPRSSSNPYQKLLSNSLLNLGVKVNSDINFLNIKPLPILRIIYKYWKPDILHIHWYDPFIKGNNILITAFKSILFLMELYVVKLLGVKICWTVHNLTSHESRYKNIETGFLKLLSRLADGIIVHSESTRKELLQNYNLQNKTIRIIPHANYIDCYENSLSQSKAREILGIGMDETVFLYFGRIRKYKDLPNLISSFNNLKVQKARLIVAGKPLDKETEELFYKNFKDYKNVDLYLNFIPDSEIQIYMNASDVVVLPYTDITTSGSVMLAISFKKPVIAPGIGNIPETIDENGGFLYDQGVQDGLLLAMKNSLNADLKKMGEYNFEIAKSLDWDSVAKNTYKFYNEILST